MDERHQLDRPTLGAEAAEPQEAIEAVARLVQELQSGWDQHDANISNRHFAADVIWGSPFGATVQGFEQLHAIHVRLEEKRTGAPSSRFEIVNVLAPAPGWRWRMSDASHSTGRAQPKSPVGSSRKN